MYEDCGNPEPVGAFLTKEEITNVTHLKYRRFDYKYGLTPAWNESQRTRTLHIREVRKVLDALALSGFKVVRMKKDEDRFPKLKENLADIKE